MQDNPLVSIIVLNCNQTDVTCEFLESTRKLNYKNYELLICDMGSEVDATEQINAGNYPNTKVVMGGGFAPLKTGREAAGPKVQLLVAALDEIFIKLEGFKRNRRQIIAVACFSLLYVKYTNFYLIVPWFRASLSQLLRTKAWLIIIS